VLSFQERHAGAKPSQMNLREAVRFALALLNTASEFDSATGGVNPATENFATIKLLKPAGVETVTERQQEEFLHD
jgi:20S proteasome alpha/beta subunit